MATAAERITRKAILCHALAKWAEKQIKKLKLRDELDPGLAVQVSGTFSGKIGRAIINEPVNGLLTVAPDGTCQPSSNPNYAQVLAVCLAAMPKSKASQLIDQFESGKLPEAPEADIKGAAELLQSLRQQLPTQCKRGAVSFNAAE